MIGRLILLAVLLVTGLAFYTCSLAFDENAEFRRGSPFYYLLVAGTIRGLPFPDDHTELRYRAFPGDGPAQPFTELRYTVPAEKADDSLALYRRHLSERNCDYAGEKTESGSVTAEWQCQGGHFRFSSSPDLRRGGDGRYVASGKVSISVAYYEIYDL